MSKTKEQVLEVIRRLPEEVDYDDIIEEIIFLAKVNQGLRYLEEGRTVSIEEVKARF